MLHRRQWDGHSCPSSLHHPMHSKHFATSPRLFVFGFCSFFGPWSLDMGHSRRLAIRATPPRQTNPPNAQRTQPKTNRARSKPRIPPNARTNFLTKQTQTPKPLRATGATPAKPLLFAPNSPRRSLPAACNTRRSEAGTPHAQSPFPCARPQKR